MPQKLEYQVKILLRTTQLNGDTIGFNSHKLTKTQSNPVNTDGAIESLRINEVSVLNS